jgi:surface antigen
MGPTSRFFWQGAFSVALAAPLIAAPIPVTAQTLISPGTITNRLTRGDLDRMNEAAKQVGAKNTVGAVEPWRNPDTRNEGSVKLVRSFETEGMPCLRMEYTIHFQRSTQQRRYFINWCKTPAGEWKIAEVPHH